MLHTSKYSKALEMRFAGHDMPSACQEQLLCRVLLLPAALGFLGICQVPAECRPAQPLLSIPSSLLHRMQLLMAV